MADPKVGDRVQIVSIGKDVTPPEWVGRHGVIVSIVEKRDELNLTHFVRLDGDRGSSPFAPSELVHEPADKEHS